MIFTTSQTSVVSLLTKPAPVVVTYSHTYIMAAPRLDDCGGRRLFEIDSVHAMPIAIMLNIKKWGNLSPVPHGAAAHGHICIYVVRNFHAFITQLTCVKFNPQCQHRRVYTRTLFWENQLEVVVGTRPRSLAAPDT